ncbi:hypothetical protein WMR74_002695 [Providencia rettgeri]
MSFFAIFGIACCFIAVIYSYLGGSSIYQIQNPDGRPNYFYITSFSNAGFGNIIRPSFIYDEPGAFSFLICFVVCFRILLKKSPLITSLIMVSGLITFSLTHFILVILYFIFNLRIRLNILAPLFIIILSGPLILNNNELKPFIDRIENFNSADNNRVNQLENFLTNVEISNVIFAGEVECQNSDVKNACYKKYGDLSSSPLSVIFYNGILGLIIQIAIYISFIYYIFKSRFFVFPSLCMLILTIQRPYFFSTGYSTMILLILFLMVFSKKPMEIHNDKT